MLTRDQIEQNIGAMEKQGASQGDIQAWLDTQKQPQAQQQPQTSKTDTGGGFLKSAGNVAGNIAMSLAKPFINVGSTIEKGLDIATGTKVPDQIEQQSSKSVGEFAGNTLEGLGYVAAPLEGAGGGFWGAAKASIPAAGLFGAGTATKDIAKGEGVGGSLAKGAATTAGVMATAGLLGLGGGLLRVWGAKLMRNPAVQDAMKYLHNFADTTYEALPEAFADKFEGFGSMADKNVQRTADALKTEYEHNFNTAKDAVIDATMANVDDPAVATSQFNHAVSKATGEAFDNSTKLYDAVKTSPEKFSDFSTAEKALSKKGLPELSAKMTPAEAVAYREASTNVSDSFNSFINEMSGVTKQKLTLGQIMGVWDSALSYLPGASNEERQVIRGFASGMYEDAKKQMAKKAPELLDDWERVWHIWGNASKLWKSPILNTLKSPGSIDNYIQKINNDSLSVPEREALLNAVNKTGMQKPVSDLFMNSLLRTSKTLKPKEASSLISNFLDKFGDVLMPADRRALLGKMSQFFDSDFNSFLSGMRNHLGLEGISPQQVESLAKQQSTLDAFKTVTNSGLDKITSKIADIKDTPEFEKIVNAMPDDEKKIVGLSVLRDFFHKDLPLFKPLPDGKFQVEKKFSDSIIKTWDTLMNSPGLQDAVGDNVVRTFEKASEVARNLKDVAYTDKGMGSLVHAFLAALYLHRGWLPGAISNSISSFGAIGSDKLATSAIEDLIKSEVIKAGKTYTVGSFIEQPLAQLASKISGGVSSNLK